MKKNTDKTTKDSLTEFVENLERVQVKVQEKDVWAGFDKAKHKNLKSLAKDLVENNIKQFSFILGGSRQNDIAERKIERIYSKNEIKQLVCSHLIPDYQQEKIINAVTEYLYGIHVSK